jgi:hypothetical protein
MLGTTRYELGFDVFSTFPLSDACYDLGSRVSSSLVTVASLMPVGFTGSSCSLLTREAALQYTHTLYLLTTSAVSPVGSSLSARPDGHPQRSSSPPFSVHVVLAVAGRSSRG